MSGDLAILGAAPFFTEPLFVGRPNLGERQAILNRINDLLDRRWLTNNGRYVREFEQRVADMAGVKHCIATSNATIGLELLIRAAGLKGEVLVPSFTFVATAHALQWQEITPVFCDVDETTLTLDPARLEAMITPRTSGIIGVHVWGRACDVDALEDIARRHNLTLLFDAAHAFGCSHKGRMVGQFGKAEVYSFHATKFLNTGEGGAVVTNDDELADKLRLMKNFGFAGMDKVVYLGTNGKMPEMSAALGLANLDSMADFVATNQQHYLHYQARLGSMPGLSVLPYDQNEKNNYQYVAVRVDAAAGLDRDELVAVLHAENVLARRYFYPGVHQMEPYHSYFPHAGMLLPVTEKVCQQIMVLPTGTSVSSSDVEAICDLLARAMRQAPAVRHALAQSGNSFKSSQSVLQKK